MIPLFLEPKSAPRCGLDQISQPVHAAYSVYRLQRARHRRQPIFRVWRSDGEELDIYTRGGYYDHHTLMGLAGSGSLRVMTIYDHSGNARDLSQSDTSLRPIIVNAGSLVTTSNGAPSMTLGSNRALFRSDSMGLTGAPALTMAMRFSSVNTSDPALLRIGASSFASAGAGIALFCDNNSAARAYFATFGHGLNFVVSNVAASHYYVGLAGAGAACGTYTLREDGVVRSVFATAGSGAVVANLTSQLTQIGGPAVSGTSPAAEANCAYFFNAVLTGNDLAGLEAELARHL